MVPTSSACRARAAQRVEISLKELHRDELDEDISVAGVLTGGRDRPRQTPVVA